MIELRYTLVKNGMFFFVYGTCFIVMAVCLTIIIIMQLVCLNMFFSYLVTDVCFFLMDLSQHVTKWTTVSSSKQSLANHNLSLGETKIPLKAC